MKSPSPLDAVLAWQALGLDWMTMMAASSHVVARRGRRRPTPARLLRMGSEKVEAAIESSNAMARQMTRLPMHDPFALWHAWARVLASGMAPYHSRATRNSRTRR